MSILSRSESVDFNYYLLNDSHVVLDMSIIFLDKMQFVFLFVVRYRHRTPS